jgi:maltokinase
VARSVISGSDPEIGNWRFRVESGGITLDAKPGSDRIAVAAEILRRLGKSPSSRPSLRTVGVDQTNLSVIVDERWIVKLIARWGTADRAAHIELLLQEAGSTDVPTFVGALDWEHPKLGRSTVAIAAEYVADSSDGWTWAADDFIAAEQSSPRADPEWPREISAMTARVHHTLAKADREAPQEVAVFQQRDRPSVAKTLGEIFGGRDDAAARRMRNRQSALQLALEPPSGEWISRKLITHGDLHVGQILRTADDRYLLLDFDGNPQWEEQGRGLHREPVERDLAHMLNSIDIVAAVAQKRVGKVWPQLWNWATRAKEQFLDGYAQQLRRLESPVKFSAQVLPALCAEQLVAEVRYAARFLPQWEYAPDGVISHRYQSSAIEEETPWTPPGLLTT